MCDVLQGFTVQDSWKTLASIWVSRTRDICTSFPIMNLSQGESILLLGFLSEDTWAVAVQHLLLQREGDSVSGARSDRWSYC